MSYSPPPRPGYAAVLALVEERAGLTAPSCSASAEEGIDRAMARAGVTDFDAYRRWLTEDPAALDDLLIELTIGETYFFRTPEHFEHLRRGVLPELRERHGPGHTARVWSAACASGEEPYSLAALLMAEGWEANMAVYATDVSRAALARARLASYGEWSLRGPATDRIRPHLRAEGRHYHLSPEVRRHVRFSYLNLALETWPSPDSGVWKLDVIFCRNVLIYFNRPTIEAVARRLHAALDDGGYLFTGPSDPPLADFAPFESILTDWGVLYRRPLPGVSVAVPTRTFTPVPEVPEVPAVHAPATPSTTVPRAPTPDVSTPATSDTADASEVDAAALAGARRALARGDWREAAQRAGALEAAPSRALAAVRALANLEPLAALHACTEAILRHPLVPGLRYLESLLLLGQGRLDDAERAVRQALYLEPGLAVAHLLLGHVLRRRGEPSSAARAYQEAESLCRTMSPDAPVPLAEGETAGRLADVAHDERRRLEGARPEAGEER